MADKRKYKGVKFINYKYPGCDPETVDQFDTYKEARAMLKEYRMAFSEGSLWISQRPYAGWYD